MFGLARRGLMKSPAPWTSTLSEIMNLLKNVLMWLILFIRGQGFSNSFYVSSLPPFSFHSKLTMMFKQRFPNTKNKFTQQSFFFSATQSSVWNDSRFIKKEKRRGDCNFYRAAKNSHLLGSKDQKIPHNFVDRTREKFKYVFYLILCYLSFTYGKPQGESLS